MNSAHAGAKGCAFYVLLLAFGCAGLPTGTPRPLPAPETNGAPRGAILVGTDRADGLRVLWNGMARGRASERESWTANDQEQLAALWHEAGPMLEVPRVDFTRQVVFGLSHWGSYCQPEIIRASVESSGVVRLHTEAENILCVDVGVRTSLVIALPRNVLGARAVLVAPEYHEAFEFSIPPAPPAGAGDSPTSPARAIAGSPKELVPLPALGHLALATLRDGSEVWVAHDSNGSVSVVSAVSSLARWPLSMLPEYLQVAVQWLPALGRFQGGWDAQGHNVHGFAPLTPRHFQLDAEGQLWVGGPSEAVAGPIRPRQDAPRLVGRARAYASPRRSSWRDLHEGELALLDWDLVSLPSQGVALCQVPKQVAALNRFRGCPSDAPRVIDAPAKPPAPAFVLRGPFMVGRTGNGARVIINAELPAKVPLRELSRERN